MTKLTKKTTGARAITLYPFQEIGVAFLLSKGNALLADDMGLGKTIQASTAAKLKGTQRGLVCCPLSVRRLWCRHLAEMFPSSIIIEVKSSKQIIKVPARGWVVLNYDLAIKDPVRKVLNEIEWDQVILDEAHYLKNITASRTLAVLSNTKGITRKAKSIWALTGTPVLNRPVELYPMLHYLFPEAIAHCQGYYDYTTRYCAGRQGTFGWDATGARNVKELSERLHPYMLRRLKSQVMKELPAVSITPIYLEASKVLQAALRQEKASLKKVEGAADRAQRLAFDEVKSLRRRIGVDKVACAIQHAKDLLLEVDKVVVFTYHRDVANGIAQSFRKEAVLYTGEQSVKQKDNSLQQFLNNSKVKLFIAQVKAGGTGIDGLQNVCHTSLFVEQGYVPGEIDQAIDRLVRIGQTKPVSVYMLIHEDSVDEDIVAILTKKRGVIKEIMSSTPEQEIIKMLQILGVLR